MIVVLSKRKPAARKNKIILLNASKRYLKGKPKNYLPEDQIRVVAALYQKGEAVDGELAIISTEKAAEADYNLSPGQWVENGEEAKEANLGDLIARYKELINKERLLETNLSAALKSIEVLL